MVLPSPLSGLFAMTFDWFCMNGELGSRRPRRESWNGLKS